jgi:UDP-N-acetylglucosamine--N-acetylmuramyl-(pentapeptide) pyrophosphoryl-undecaprenol N-acetylglucosamine transferase
MTSLTTVRIVLTGGGSGGHVYPLLAVAEELKQRAAQSGADLELYYCGPDDTYAAAFVEAGVTRISIAGPKLRRYFSVQNFLDGPKFFIALAQAWWKLFWLMPDVVFSKGGPGSLPVVLLAWFYRIPIIIHESDAVPGLNNIVSSRLANRIGISFESARAYFNPRLTAFTGNPIRRFLLGAHLDEAVAKRELGFAEDKPLILVLGGSQGSQRINEFILVNLKELTQNVQILHQTGLLNYREVQTLSRAVLLETAPEQVNRYRAVPLFEKDLAVALAGADVVVARAGSGTISEIAVSGKPAILLPLPEAANDHQRKNAYEFSKTGGAIVIEESNLQYGIFMGQLNTLLKDEGKLQAMGAASLKFAKPNAAAELAGEVLGLTAAVH